MGRNTCQLIEREKGMRQYQQWNEKERQTDRQIETERQRQTERQSQTERHRETEIECSLAVLKSPFYQM